MCPQMMLRYPVRGDVVSCRLMSAGIAYQWDKLVLGSALSVVDVEWMVCVCVSWSISLAIRRSVLVISPPPPSYHRFITCVISSSSRQTDRQTDRRVPRSWCLVSRNSDAVSMTWHNPAALWPTFYSNSKSFWSVFCVISWKIQMSVTI